MSQASTNRREFEDGFVTLDGQPFYLIQDFERLGPFLINVVSASDLWMFLSSHGGLTAGRVNPDNALFAYETVDRLHDAHHYAGPVTAIHIRTDGRPDFLWEPFRQEAAGRSRNLYKSLAGNIVVFEEILHEFDLTYRYRWTAAEELGFVRTCTLRSAAAVSLTVEVLDGLRNLQPWGLPLGLVQQYSCLTDAHKRSEVDAETGLGVYSLTSGIVDGTYPTEVLRSNVVWQCGLADAQIGLAAETLVHFRQRQPFAHERLLKGRRGNFFVRAALGELLPGEQKQWHLVADVGLGHVQLAALRDQLLKKEMTSERIEQSISRATESLRVNVAASDGLQHTADQHVTAHHFSNVLFNNMRGGVFVDEADVAMEDVAEFVEARNPQVFQRYHDLLCEQAGSLDQLRSAARNAADVDLRRLVDEFLPLTFGRRHGDPSRPWNRFSIELKKPDGSRALRYQGNWRDIFQNWEALCVSYPQYFDKIVAKFVNGSTADGFNPYRVTERGMEWEVPEPEDPWSNIGYWGDHQIIYLLKLLEALRARQPERLHEMLAAAEFVYLDVPYRLKPYSELVRNVRETVSYDSSAEQRIAQRMEALGEDGKLLQHEATGAIVHVNLAEKLLVPLLSKLSNLVLGGGIWMNTQRPEWNDANNALVGNGLSVVTLCYLLRYAKFLVNLLDESGLKSFLISREVVLWLRATQTLLQQHRPSLQAGQLPAQEQRQMFDALGRVFCEYRGQVYEHGLSDAESLSVDAMTQLCDLASEYAEHTLRLNKREDSLYDAYNLADFSHDGHLQVRHLYEMLEGQVAILSSGLLSMEEAADLVETMFDSRLYREDQHSFLLYPERELPDFLDKNVIPETGITSNPLLTQLLSAGDTSVIQQDSLGAYRFHANFQHSLDLDRALDQLKLDDRWLPLVVAHRRETIELFDNVFQHHSYTGRSGTMYGYEGLGCIYWHMVAKLLLAIQENHRRAVDEDSHQTERLRELYYKVRSGLGFEKQPHEYGAFPTDAYSHTPRHAGAQQPGMTGQVKEEILTRLGELGIRVVRGCLSIQPSLLRISEFVEQPSSFAFVARDGQAVTLEVPDRGLAFTYGQIPFVYQLTDGDEAVSVMFHDGQEKQFSELLVDQATTGELLDRHSDVARVHVHLKPGRLYCP